MKVFNKTVLNKDSVGFIKIKYIKKKNNTRKMFLRTFNFKILLGIKPRMKAKHISSFFLPSAFLSFFLVKVPGKKEQKKKQV